MWIVDRVSSTYNRIGTYRCCGVGTRCPFLPWIMLFLPLSLCVALLWDDESLSYPAGTDRQVGTSVIVEDFSNSLSWSCISFREKQDATCVTDYAVCTCRVLLYCTIMDGMAWNRIRYKVGKEGVLCGASMQQQYFVVVGFAFERILRHIFFCAWTTYVPLMWGWLAEEAHKELTRCLCWSVVNTMILWYCCTTCCCYQVSTINIIWCFVYVVTLYRSF